MKKILILVFIIGGISRADEASFREEMKKLNINIEDYTPNNGIWNSLKQFGSGLIGSESKKCRFGDKIIKIRKVTNKFIEECKKHGGELLSPSMTKCLGKACGNILESSAKAGGETAIKMLEQQLTPPKKEEEDLK